MTASARPQESEKPAPVNSKKESDDQQQKQEALMATIKKDGESGLNLIKSYVLPSLGEQKSSIPIFLAEKNSFFSIELRRIALQYLVYEYWPAVQNLHTLFLKKTKVAKKEDITEIKEIQKKIVEDHVSTRFEIQQTIDERNKKLAREEEKKKHLHARTQLKERLSAKLATLQPLSLKPRRPSTASRASHTSTSSAFDADTLLHNRKSSNSLVRLKSSFSTEEHQSASASPSRLSHCSSNSNSSSQRDWGIHTALGVISEPFPPTPRFYAPERSWNAGESIATEEQKAIRLNVSGEKRRDIVDRYLNDTLIDSNFEARLINSGVKDLIEQFFLDLKRNASTDFVLLHKAEQRDKEYSLVKKALSQFIEVNLNNTNYGMASAVKCATIALKELLELKTTYNYATRFYPQLLKQYQEVKISPAHRAFGSQAQKDAQQEEKDIEKLLTPATAAFNHFDQAFENFCSKTTKALETIYRHSPFVSAKTVASIQSIMSTLSTASPPQKPQKQNSLLNLFSKTHAAAVLSIPSFAKEGELISTVTARSNSSTLAKHS